MHGGVDRRNAGSHRAWLSLGLVVGLLALPPAPAMADEAAYGSRAKDTIMQLVAGREFKAESGCDRSEPCASLLARLRTGDFDVVEPAERSDRPDMPSYLKARKRCPRLDLAHVVAAHRRFTATRNFAIYRLDLPPRPAKGGEEVLIFRAQHYVMLEGKGLAAEDGDESVAFWPGNFVAIGVPSCRFLSIALAEDGDRFAKHNAVDDTDYASELLKLGDRYFVLNLDPIAGPHQAKETWWYALQLWDLGTHGDADRRKQRHLYSFGYKPTATSLGDDAAPLGLGRGQALAPRG
jgi:hypothetical protein